MPQTDGVVHIIGLQRRANINVPFRRVRADDGIAVFQQQLKGFPHRFRWAGSFGLPEPVL